MELHCEFKENGIQEQIFTKNYDKAGVKEKDTRVRRIDEQMTNVIYQLHSLFMSAPQYSHFVITTQSS